jgi:hypothetical protein
VLPVRLALLSRARRISPEAKAALAVFLVALAARLLWVALVESPYDNLYSDMATYVERALDAAYGGGERHAFLGALYPPGAHLVYAAEMRLVGWGHHAPLLLLNCAWGAVVAPCALLLSLRIVPHLRAAVFVGLLVATWYPLLTFAGFFSSEQPYAGALALSAWLLVRVLEGRQGAVALGIAAGVAYLVRPQLVLTLATLAVVGLVLLVRARRDVGPARSPESGPGHGGVPRLPVRGLLVAGAILSAAVAFGALRYHAIRDRWALISDNATMTRLWADTDYGKISTYEGTYEFVSPPKHALGEHRELRVHGYIGDPEQIEEARRTAVASMTTGQRVRRWVANVGLLFGGVDLWPDNIKRRGLWRVTWLRASTTVLLAALCPLALLGIASCARRPRTALVVCSAHVLTALVVAMFFYGEQRYRVPYDVFIVLLALEGARVLGLLRLARLEPADAAPAPEQPLPLPAPPAKAPPARTATRAGGRRKRKRGR